VAKPEWHECIIDLSLWRDGHVHGVWIQEWDPRTKTRFAWGPAFTAIIREVQRYDRSAFKSYGPGMAQPGIASHNEAMLCAVYDWWKLDGLREIPIREYLTKMLGEP
jgi:hypothetical protein